MSTERPIYPESCRRHYRNMRPLNCEAGNHQGEDALTWCPSNGQKCTNSANDTVETLLMENIDKMLVFKVKGNESLVSPLPCKGLEVIFTFLQ